MGLYLDSSGYLSRQILTRPCSSRGMPCMIGWFGARTFMYLLLVWSWVRSLLCDPLLYMWMLPGRSARLPSTTCSPTIIGMPLVWVGGGASPEPPLPDTISSITA